MSTSTYVPTFLSVKNCPERTVIETVPAMIPSTYAWEKNKLKFNRRENEMIFCVVCELW
jgi:hypothetical protein